MSTIESTEDREKAYQKQYQSDRLLRRRFSYEALEKKHRVTVKGKDLSAELMRTRAPGVTGESPWVKDLSAHPLQWHREGIPADLPRHIPNAFGDLAPGRDFTDPRMLFDASLFESMTDEEIAYFNDQKHWVVEDASAGDALALDTELEDEPGCYGYLVHLNRGRKELNNPPVAARTTSVRTVRNWCGEIPAWRLPTGSSAVTSSTRTWMRLLPAHISIRCALPSTA